MNYWYNTLKLFYGLTKFSNAPSKNIIIKRNYYPGLNNLQIPSFEFYPNKNSNMIMILYHGASPFAEEHPGMITLGQALAYAGIKVHIPRLPLLKDLEITTNSVDWIAHHLNWYRETNQNKNHIIIPVGISFAGALLLKSLLHPLIKSSQPKSIFTYGTFFDFNSSINFLLKGKINHNGKSYKITPNDWGLIVLFHNYLKYINPGFDSTQIRNVLKLRVQNKVLESEKALLLLPKNQQKLINNIFSAKITEQIEDLSNKMINACKKEIIQISPSNWVNKIKTQVFIMHGVNDTIVPFTESILLDKKLKNSKLLISKL